MKGKTLTLALLAAVLLSSPAAAEGWFQPGAYGMVGSGGYGRAALTADGGWKEKAFDPYVSSELASDNYERTFTLTGGASKELNDTLTGRAGAGFVVGHVDNTTGGAGSLILELGLDKHAGPGTLLGEYSLTAGKVAAETYVRSTGKRKGTAAQLTATRAEAYHSFTAGYRVPLKSLTLTFSESAGFATYQNPLFTTSVKASVAFGAAKEWTAFTTLAVDSGRGSGAYVSAGLSRMF